jgi:hypothetical protein
MKSFVLLVCSLSLLIMGCEKKTQPGAASRSPKPNPANAVSGKETESIKIHVCDLLKPDELEPLVGASIGQSKSSERTNRNLRISQCLYAATPAAKSVSLIVTQPDPAQGTKESTREFWQKAFAPARAGERKQKANVLETGDPGDDGPPPQAIEGLGEEAFWAGGSLYVLKGEIFIRLSLGGPAPEGSKLERSRALAELALKRL